MKRFFTLLNAICLLITFAYADENKVFQGCSGGMMLHAGYLFGNNPDAPYSPQGMTYGVGGAARVHLWQHLRIGGEGYVSTMPSSVTNFASVLKSGSYVRTGWGGLLVDCCWRGEKSWPYIGATIGGGGTNSLYIIEGNQNDWEREEGVIFNKRGFFAIAPFVGCDYALTSRIHLTFKADWVLAIHNKQLLRPTGPRLYIGFMFCH